MSGPLELERPFFARADPKRFIDLLAHVPTLCMYAGAGVSIDRTGLDWKGLAVHLLTSKTLNTDEAEAQILVHRLGPHRVGSVIARRYSDITSSAHSIENALRDLLYRHQDILAGRLVRAIAELWLDFVSAGRPVRILTTNYDEHIELAIWDLVRTSANLLEAKRRPIPSLPEKATWVDHLHGTIPENAEVTDPPVMSERDYLASANKSETALVDAFNDQHVLILGSGLQDPPLLNALLRTADARDRGFHRLALVPREDLGAADPSRESASTILAYEQRLNEFGVEGVYCDYFSQVTQFLGEARLAMRLKPSCRLSRSSGHVAG